MTDVDKLVEVVRDLHGVPATHVRSEPVHVPPMSSAVGAVRASIAAERRT